MAAKVLAAKVGFAVGALDAISLGSMFLGAASGAIYGSVIGASYKEPQPTYGFGIIGAVVGGCVGGAVPIVAVLTSPAVVPFLLYRDCASSWKNSEHCRSTMEYGAPWEPDKEIRMYGW